MKKVLKTGGWVLVGLFVIYTFYFLWKQSQPAPVVYELVAPEQRDVVKQTIATGTLEARTQVELKPQITGVVTELRVKPGQTVKAGDLVAEPLDFGRLRCDYFLFGCHLFRSLSTI